MGSWLSTLWPPRSNELGANETVTTEDTVKAENEGVLGGNHRDSLFTKSFQTNRGTICGNDCPCQWARPKLKNRFLTSEVLHGASVHLQLQNQMRAHQIWREQGVVLRVQSPQDDIRELEWSNSGRSVQIPRDKAFNVLIREGENYFQRLVEGDLPRSIANLDLEGFSAREVIEAMACGLAIFHWVAKLDAGPISFLFLPEMLPGFVPLARPSQTAYTGDVQATMFRSTKGYSLSVVLMFTGNQPLLALEEGINKASVALWDHARDFPRPGTEKWKWFLDQYVKIALQVCEKREAPLVEVMAKKMERAGEHRRRMRRS